MWLPRLTLRERNRVQVLLRSDGGDTDAETADALDICTATVVALRKRVSRSAKMLERAILDARWDLPHGAHRAGEAVPPAGPQRGRPGSEPR